MSWKEHKVMKELGITSRKSRVGLVLFLLFYQFIMSPTCIIGYTQELLGTAKRW